MFTIAQALTRLNALQRNPFTTSYGTMSSGQQLARINQILETWYDSDSWRGVRSVQALTSSAGIIALPAAYLRAEKRISVTTTGKGGFFQIKPIQYQFESGGPGWFDVTKNSPGVAIDLGDNASGVRHYQLTGVAADLDALAYSAVLRLRYVYATDTAPAVIPDCFSALELSIRAMAAADANANELSLNLWLQAYQKLDSSLGQYEEGNDMGILQIDPFIGMGSVENLV